LLRAKCPPVLIILEAEWIPEPIRTLWRREKYLALAEYRTPVFQPVARRYNECAIENVNVIVKSK
jgi:hypothetical protein